MPNGQYVIAPDMGPAFVETLPVGKFHGIGPATAAKMHALGLLTGLDIRNRTLPFLEAKFGKSGTYYYWILKGIDERQVRANRIQKSVGAENTVLVVCDDDGRRRGHVGSDGVGEELARAHDRLFPRGFDRVEFRAIVVDAHLAAFHDVKEIPHPSAPSLHWSKRTDWIGFLVREGT